MHQQKSVVLWHTEKCFVSYGCQLLKFHSACKKQMKYEYGIFTGKPKCLEKKLSHCHFPQHSIQILQCRFWLRPLQWGLQLLRDLAEHGCINNQLCSIVLHFTHTFQNVSVIWGCYTRLDKQRRSSSNRYPYYQPGYLCRSSKSCS